jgi:hypothetical protein
MEGEAVTRSGTGWMRFIWASLYAAVLAVGVTLGIRVVVDGYSPVPFSDLWAMFPFIERGVRGDFGVSDLWAQHNEHRMALARLQFLVDYRYFEGRNIFLFASIATTCLLLAAVFASAVWLEMRDWLVAFGTLAVAGASALPGAGSENLTLAVNVAFVEAFLFSTVSILGVVLAARAHDTRRKVIWSCVTGIATIAATYALANGLLAWVVVVVLAIVLQLDRRCTTALVVVGGVTTATYLWHFEFTNGVDLTHPIELAHYVLLYLGAAPTPTPGTAAIAGAVGLGLLVVLCRLTWVERLDGAILVPFGAGVAAFVALTALQTAGGRLELGVAQALSSRYSIASYIFWLALFVGFLPTLERPLRRMPWALPAYLAVVAAIALVLGYGASPSGDDLRSLKVGRKATIVGYRAGIEDDTESIRDVQFVWTPVTNGLRWLDREELGPFVPGGIDDELRVAGPVTATEHQCLGKLDPVEAVRGGIRLGGWIASPTGEPSSPRLVVLDANRRRAGLGLVGFHRTDVAHGDIPDADWTGFIAYVRGDPMGLLQVVLLGADGRTALCRLLRTGGPA